MSRPISFAGLAGIACLAAMSDGGKHSRKKPQLRQYSEPLGPPYPTTRQQRRNMIRQSQTALGRLARQPNQERQS